MKTPKRFLTLASTLVAIWMVSGCGESNPTNSFDPTVSNVTDDFIFRANNVYVVTTRLTYNWTNTGQTASVEHLSGTSGGTGTLSILDADGKPVYNNTLESSLTNSTTAGNPGVWSVILELNNYSGNIYFHLRKT